MLRSFFQHMKSIREVECPLVPLEFLECLSSKRPVGKLRLHLNSEERKPIGIIHRQDEYITRTSGSSSDATPIMCSTL